MLVTLLSQDMLVLGDSLVLAHIVICTSLLVGIVCLEARVRHMFLIQTPADASVVQEINDCLGARRDIVRIIVSDPEGVATNSGHVVRLRYNVSKKA